MTTDLTLICISLFTWGAGEGLFLYFQPLYLQQLGADPVAIGVILGASGIMMMVGQAPAGYLADRIGRRPVMWVSWFLGLIAIGVMALANSLTVFVVGLLLYGITAFAIPPLNAYVSATANRWSVGRVMTAASASYQFGSVLGPFIGGQLGQGLGFKSIYTVAAGIVAVSVLVILFIHPQPVHPHDATHPTGSLIKNQRFTAFLVFAFLAMLATSLPLTFTPNYLQNEHHLTLSAIGQLGSLGNLGSALLTLGLGSLTPSLVYTLGQLSVAIFSLVIWRSSGMPWFALGYLFYGGFRLCRLMATVIVRPIIRPVEVGLAYGLLETINAATTILAPILAGFLYQQNPFAVYPVSIGILALSMLGSGWFLKFGRQSLPPACELTDPRSEQGSAHCEEG